MQGIESDGEDQSPGHQAQERGEHLKADRGQGQDEAGANEDVEKEGGGSPLELGIGIGQCGHGVSPSGMFCDTNAGRVEHEAMSLAAQDLTVYRRRAARLEVLT